MKKQSKSIEDSYVKVAKVGLKKEEGFEYFLDDEGDICCRDLQNNVRKIVRTGIKKNAGLYYFIDDFGDVSAVSDVPGMINELREEEKNVRQIFQLAGFKVTQNPLLKAVHIDVLAEKDNFKIVCECKFENSEGAVRNSIQYWKGRNKEIGANRIIIALFGTEVLGEDRAMAEANMVLIWQEDNIKNFLDLLLSDRKEGVKKLLGELDIKTYADPSISYERTADQ